MDDETRRHHHRARVVLEDERLGHLVDVAARGVVEVEALPVREDAVADLEDLRVGLIVGDGDRDRVERAGRLVGDALALEQTAHGSQTVALARRVLEALLVRGLLHRSLELALDFAIAPREKRDHAVDPLAVVVLGDVADARCLAALDVVVEARASRCGGPASHPRTSGT